MPYRPTWPDDARRIINRLQMACGAKALRVDHIGSTAVPGMDAKDVIDIQVTVESLDIADELADALADVGYPAHRSITGDTPHDGDPSLWRKRIHGAADPGRPANVHVRVDGWPNQQFALLFVDWLKANPAVREEYLAAKRQALEAAGLRRGQGAVVPRRLLACAGVGRVDRVAAVAVRWLVAEQEPREPREPPGALPPGWQVWRFHRR